MTNVSSAGWYATVTLANGTVLEPSILDGDGVSPTQNPQSNARPGIRLPIPKDALEQYRSILDDGSSDVDLDVWHDGARQPIDTLVDVDDAPGHTVLVGEGARELKTRVEASFDQKAVHLAGQDLVDNNTTYLSNVDTPPTTTETNTTLVTLTSNSDWLTRIGFTDTDPLSATGGTLTVLQTCFTEGEVFTNVSDSNGAQFNSGGDADATYGESAEFQDAGDFLEYTFTNDYIIPAEDFELLIRQETDGADSPGVSWQLDGEEIGSQGQGVMDLASYVWLDRADTAPSSDIQPGTHTLRFEATASGTDDWRVCTIAPRDGGGSRFTPNYTDDNTLDGNSGHLDGPELFPAEVQAKFDIVPAPQAVTGIRAEATLDEGASDYTHYVSNDQGANFTTGTGSNLETDSLGASWGPGITYKAGLSSTGSRTGDTPKTGFNATDLQSLTLKADLEDMPLVVNRTFDGHLDAILRELAEIGDQLWEFGFDPRANVGTFDISNATFSQSFSLRDDFPRGMAWNDDGSKLYEVGEDTGTIYEYDLSTAFDVSTATFSQSISSQDDRPQDIIWNNSGSKLYEVGIDGGSTIYEYDVSTDFDISTASSSQSISGQESIITGIEWNDNGTKLYEIGTNNDNIYESDVSSSFDISTASFSQSINTQDANPTGIAWNDSGTKLYEVGLDSDNIYEYDVSTAFDVSTATFSQSINTQDSQPRGVAWNNDGSKLYEVGEDTDQAIYEYDVEDIDSTFTVEWTSPGQRTATRTPSVTDFQATKTVGTVYQKAIVYGQPDTPVRGERFESNHGSAVSLGHDRIQSGSERVTDPDTGQRYRSGSDYTLDYQAGEITVQASGDMADASTFEIDYNYQAYGEFDDGTASPNVTPRIDLPGLWSDFLCQQAARLIIDEVSTPIHTARVTLPNDATGWSVVESIDPDVVPTGGNALHVKDVENTPQATVLTLGSRRSVSDVVGDIRAQVGAVSRKA